MSTRHTLAGAVALLLALAGCGDNGTPAASPAPVATPSPSSSAAPDLRLLDVGDLGGVWKAGGEINAEDLASFAQSPCSSTVDPGVAGRLTAVAGAQFEPTAPASQHLIELVVTGDPTPLERDLNALFEVIAACGKASPAPGKVTVRDFTLPDLGDQRRGFTVLQTLPGRSATVVSVRDLYVRIGSVAVVLGVADFGATADGHSSISDATAVQYLRTAVAKLAA